MRLRNWAFLLAALAAFLVMTACGGGGSASTPPPPPPPVTVTVSPATATVNAGLTVQLSAAVANTSNAAVTWAVTGGAANGAISASGLYTAPAPPPSGAVTVTATSQADATVSGSATITVAPAITVTVSPATAQVNAGLTRQFTATVANTSNTAVTWAVTGGAANGTITAAGLYTAPATPPAGAVTVTATSQADAAVASAASITVEPAITVTVSPATAVVNVGRTEEFTATVADTSNTAVTWAVTGGAANGIISATGLYTAPATPPSGAVTVTATSEADASKSGGAAVTVEPAITVTVSPATASVNAGLTQQFTASVANATNGNVTWSVSGGAANGTISATGLYTAPATPPAGAVTVTATSQADSSKSGSATVTVAPAITVSVSPATGNVYAGQTQQFTASVANTTNGNVTWSVNGGAANGTISAAGLYTAPATPPAGGSATVMAASQADPNATGTASVTVQSAITVTVTAASSSVNAGLTDQFSATVGPTGISQSVTWQVNGTAGGDSTNGTISASGLYTAPATPPVGAVSITATSGTGAVVSSPYSLTVAPAVTVTIAAQGTPPSVLVAGASETFTATVQNNSNQGVHWEVNGVANGNSTTGLISSAGVYTAPKLLPPGGGVTVTAVAQADASATSNSISVTDGWSTASLDGAYVFAVQGVDAKGEPITEMGEFTADGNGNITGEADFSGVSFAPATAGNVNGTYNILPNGTGGLEFVNAGDGTAAPEGTDLVYAVVIDANGNARLIEEDSNASVAGSLWAQKTATAAPSGSYVFGMPHEIGLITAASGVWSGTEDINNAGTPTMDASVSGTFGAPDSNGRATMTLVSGTTTEDYVYYAVSASRIELIRSDNGVKAIGRADAQASGMDFSRAAFAGTYVFQNQGTQSASSGGQALSEAGQFTADGANITKGTVDERIGASNTPGMALSSFAYNVGPHGDGEYTLTLDLPAGTQLYAVWMYSATGGEMLEIDDKSDAQGTIAQQQNGPFGTNALYGEYALQIIGGSSATPIILQGEIAALNGDLLGQGDSVISGTVNNGPPPAGAVLYLVGTYTVDSAGEATGTLIACSGTAPPTSATACPSGDNQVFTTTLDFWIGTASESSTGTIESGRAYISSGNTTDYWQGTLTQQY